MSMDFRLPSNLTSQVSKTIPKKNPHKSREKDSPGTFRDLKTNNTKQTFADLQQSNTQGYFKENANKPYISENQKRLMELAETTLKENGGKGKIDNRLDKEEVRTLLGDKGADKFDEVWNNGFHQEKNSKGVKLIEAQEFYNMFHGLYG